MRALEKEQIVVWNPCVCTTHFYEYARYSIRLWYFIVVLQMPILSILSKDNEAIKHKIRQAPVILKKTGKLVTWIHRDLELHLAR